jgi:hypothetical protein
MRNSRWLASILSSLLLLSFLAALTASASMAGPHSPLPAAVDSATSLGSTFQISFSGFDTEDPVLAYNPHLEEYLVVWLNDRLSNDDIQAQRVSAGGELIGSPFFVSSGPGGNRYVPDVAYNFQRQEYLVIWALDTAGSGFELHAQAVTAQGGLTGPDVIFGTGIYSIAGFHVAYSTASDKYLVVRGWASQPSDYLYGQVLNSDGSVSGSSFTIAGPISNVQGAHVAYNRSRNEYLVAWSEYPSPTGSREVRARRVQGNGTPMYPESLTITDLAEHQWAEAVAAMPTDPDHGQYLVGFEHVPSTTAEQSLWALRLEGEGQALGSHLPVFETEEENIDLALAANEHSLRHLAVCKRTYTGIHGQPSVILGRELSLEGLPVGEEVWIAMENATSPAVAAGPAGQYLVVFADKPGTSTIDIYGRVWGVRHLVFLPVVLR